LITKVQVAPNSTDDSRLRLKERGYLPTNGVKVLSTTMSERARRCFVSVQVEMDLPTPIKNHQPLAGVDLGIARLATVSDGTGIENPRALKNALWKIKRL
jgi:transposase